MRSSHREAEAARLEIAGFVYGSLRQYLGEAFMRRLVSRGAPTLPETLIIEQGPPEAAG